MEADTVTTMLDEIAPVVEHVRNGRMSQDGLYLCIVKAAFAKNFEFNRLIFLSEGACDPFAFNSSLRGLCEDIIGLKYIGAFSIADRNEAALLLANKQTFAFVQKQHEFFRPTDRRSRFSGTMIFAPGLTLHRNPEALGENSRQSNKRTDGHPGAIFPPFGRWRRARSCRMNSGGQNF